MRLLEEVQSLCPSCLQVVSAQIYTDDFKVYMQKECPSHGEFKCLIWSDLKQYQSSPILPPSRLPLERATNIKNGCPYDCGFCPQHNQHTCLAIVEVTQNCNLGCPVCLASSPYPSKDIDVEQFENMLKALVRCEGQPVPVQLSGGEPATRKDLVELVQIAVNLGFGLVEVDTNGIELAKNPRLAKDLADAGLTGVYLQFDGISGDVYERLRGFDLLQVKERAIENANKAGLSIVLAVTAVKGVNDYQLWPIVNYALKKGAISVNFQTFAALGRFPENFFDPLNRVTIPDVKIGLESQSGGKLRREDFTPIPSLKRCVELSYLAIKKDEITSINRLVNSEKFLKYYDKLSTFEEILEAAENACSASRDFSGDTSTCCCSPRATPKNTFNGKYFSIGIHSPQDVWTAEIGRWKTCCIQELTVDGTLIPFCLYNITSLDGKTLYRGRLKL